MLAPSESKFGPIGPMGARLLKLLEPKGMVGLAYLGQWLQADDREQKAGCAGRLVAMCHPPVGLNLYAASCIAKIVITELTIAVLPWLMAMVAFLAVVTFVPELSLWLPRTLGLLR